jgi:WD40 repeat protein/serine/threonine protein kinase
LLDPAARELPTAPRRRAGPPAEGTDTLCVPGYEILGELGRGGEGVVYKARQVALNRLVALKVLLAGPAAAPAALSRFRDEADAVASLNHPHVVQIHDVGVHDGRPYFALEFADGGSLARWIDGAPQPPATSARVVETLARAVHVAHAQGIVHRDLKPGNVLLFHRPAAGGAAPSLEEFTAKISDFGIAKRLYGRAARTCTGQVLGTPSYMAPEQAEGRPGKVGPAADVYALGAILYEMLTGRPPFLAADPVEVVLQVCLADPRPPSRLRPGVPADLDTICLKCLHKEPARRYASARDLADDLRRFLDDEPIRARPVGPVEQARRWCRRKPALAGLTAALVFVILAGLVGLTSLWLVADEHRRTAEAKSSQAEEQESRTADALRREGLARAEGQRRLARLYETTGTRLLDDGDLFGALVWLTEAQRLDGEAGQDSEERRRRDEMHRQRLGAVLAQCPRLLQIWFLDTAIKDAAFSADGGRVVLAAGTAARVYDAGTGGAASPPVRHEHTIRGAAFSPDGRRLFTNCTDNRVGLWDAATGEDLVAAAVPEADRKAFWGAFVPDGRLVVNHPSGKLCFWDPATGAANPLVKRVPAIHEVAFSPDGRHVAAAWENRVQVRDAASGALLTTTIGLPGRVAGIQFHPNGRRLLAWTRDSSARLWDVETGRPAGPELPHNGHVLTAAFSADGGRMLTAGDDGTARLWDTKDSKSLAPPLRHAAAVTGAGFSPDGRLVATAGDDGTARLWDAATGQPAAPPLKHGQGVSRAAFSPDGTRLLTTCRDGTARLWDLTGRGPVAVTVRHQKGVLYAGFSPDGRRLVTAGEDGVARVWDTAGAAVTAPLRHPGPVHHAAFHPDGRRLGTAATVPVNGRDEGWVVTWDLVTGQPEPGVLRVNVGAVRHVSYGPGGARVLLRGPYTANVFDTALGRDLVSKGYAGSTAPALSPDGRRLLRVIGGENQAAVLLDVATDQQLGPRMHEGATHAAFAPDGQHVVTAGLDGTARLWDLGANGMPLPAATLRHDGPVHYAAFSADGARVVTIGDDQAARVWLAATGAPVAAPLRHAGRLAEAGFHPDGRRLFTITEPPGGTREGGQVRLWDSWTGQPLTPALRHGGRVHHAEFSPDGTRLLSACADGQARLWEVPAEDSRPVDDLLLLARVLSGQHLDDRAAAAALSPDRLCAAWEELRRRYPAEFGAGER